MSRWPVVLVTVLLAAPAAVPSAPAAVPSARAAAAPADSLAPRLLEAVGSPFAPTECVMPEDQDPRAVRQLLAEQVAADGCARMVFVPAEHNMVADGVGTRR